MLRAHSPDACAMVAISLWSLCCQSHFDPLHQISFQSFFWRSLSAASGGDLVLEPLLAFKFCRFFGDFVFGVSPGNLTLEPLVAISIRSLCWQSRFRAYDGDLILEPLLLEGRSSEAAN